MSENNENIEKIGESFENMDKKYDFLRENNTKRENYLIKNVLIAPGGENKNEKCCVVNVYIKDGIIEEIDFSRNIDDNIYGAVEEGNIIDCKEEKLLLTGFLNNHTHSSEIWSRGNIKCFPLELWLCELIEYATEDPEMVYLSAMMNGIETILSGGTAVMDHLSLIREKPLETIKKAVEAYNDLGLRAFVAPLIGDIDINDSVPSKEYKVKDVTKINKEDSEENKVPQKQELPEQVKELTDLFLTALEEAVQSINVKAENEGIVSLTGKPLVQVAVGPTGIQLCSDDIIKGCIDISNKYDLARHTHLLETKAQAILAYEKYGKSAVEYLDEIGFLNEKTSCAHSIHLNENDMEIIKKNNSTLVHNPLSNLRLGSGIAPVLTYLSKDINVSFGCDGSASNDSQNLLESIKIGSMLHNPTESDYRKWISPAQSFELASLGGYTSVGLQDKLGSLEKNKIADLVLFDLTSDLSMLPKTDPLGQLAWGSPKNVVDYVWIDGYTVVKNKSLVHVDLEKFKKVIREKQPNFSYMPRKSELAESLEAKYRNVLSIDNNNNNNN